jgi:smad nuclear-interacting protein 1
VAGTWQLASRYLIETGMAHEKDEFSSSRKAGKLASNELRERRRSRSRSRSRSPPRHRRDVRGGGSKWDDDDDGERYRKRRDGRGGQRNGDGDDAEEEEDRYPRRDRGDVDSRSGKRRDDGGERNGHRSSSRREEYRDRSRSRSPARRRRRQGNDESDDERLPKRRDRSASVAARNNDALVRGSPSSRALERERKSSKDAETPDLEAEEASKPNFSPSGNLAAETNIFKGVVLKYHEPPEGRKPVASGKNGGWRLYVFKGKEELGTFSDILQIPRVEAF